MLKRNFFSVLLVALWFQVQPALADLSLVLTQGRAAAIPIAIIPFANAKQLALPGEPVTQVISNDLTNSGQFKVMPPSSFTSQPTTVDDVKMSYWRQQNASDILLGQVKKVGINRYAVSFQLLSVNTAKPQLGQPDNPTVLISQTYSTTEAGLRNLAHQISNQVYQQLTGVKGVFTTKIAYILVQHSPSKSVVYSLEVADQDGFNPHPVLRSYQPIMSPTWSPSGQQLAYVSFENNRSAIYLQDLSSGKRRMLSEYPGINGAPAFSPDGKKLALVLTRSGNPKLYMMTIATGQLQELTFGSSIDTEPSWSADGQSIVFTSNRGGGPQIYQYSLVNKQVQRLTFEGNYNARASYLPNGSAIVMMHRETGLFGIAKQNLTSGSLQVLTESGNDESPSLAPNGKMVLYATKYAGREVLALVSIDGRVKLRLPSRDGDVREPSWSPFL
jgi:TolB protein